MDQSWNNPYAYTAPIYSSALHTRYTGRQIDEQNDRTISLNSLNDLYYLLRSGSRSLEHCRCRVSLQLVPELCRSVRQVGSATSQLALRRIHAIIEPRAPTRLSGTPPYTLATLAWPSAPGSPRLAAVWCTGGAAAAASRPAQPPDQPSSATMALRTAASCCSSLRSSPLPGEG